MSFITEVTLYGLFSGVAGTALGAIISCFFPKNNQRYYSCVLNLSAGIMIGVSVFNLIPNACALSGLGSSIIWVIIGIVVTLLLDRFFVNNSHSHAKLGYLIAIGLALHNLPEGIAIGMGYSASTALGFSVAISIIVHDIPEGMSVALPILKDNKKKTYAIFITILSGVPTAFGAYIGAVLGTVSNSLIGPSLAFAAGIMLCISMNDILPDAENSKVSSIYSIIGVLIGLCLHIFER